MSWIRLQDVLKTKKLLLVKSSIVHVSGFLDLPGIKTINLCFVLHSFKEMTKILNVILVRSLFAQIFSAPWLNAMVWRPLRGGREQR